MKKARDSKSNAINYGNKQRRILRKHWLLYRDRKNRERRAGIRRGKPQRFWIETLLGLDQYTRSSVRATPDHMFIIDLPQTLDYEENYEATASHFRILRRAARSKSRLKTLRFDKIRFISPSAALVLASEVDSWNQIVRGRLRPNIESWHEDIERLFFEMGYFELLNLPHPAELSPTKKTTFLKFKRGDLNEPNAGQIAKELRREIENLVGSSIKKHLLFDGLSEAITNVSQHAYSQSDDVKVKQWWLSASYNREQRSLCVMFYDQGVGIPETLPSSYAYEMFKEIFHAWADSQKIEAAMKIGRSSTEAAERGKGLQNLVDFAQSYREGVLSIYSLRGLYRMLSKRDGAGLFVTTDRKDHKTSVGGTLIEWTVKLD